MKILTIVSIIQTFAVLVLIGMVFKLTQSIRSIETTTPQVIKNPVQATIQASPKASDTPHPLTEAQLRTIINEEWEIQYSRLIDAGITKGFDNSSTKPRRKIATQAELKSIEEEIDYYISVGNVSEADMGNLQAKIAKLDENARKEMFKKLFKALNNGQINGRL